MINYFNFKKLNNDYLLTNDLGRYMFASKAELTSLIKDKVNYCSQFGKQACDNFFAYDGSVQSFSKEMIPYMRDSKSYLFSATSLHIFVITNSCNMSCMYCQAQNGNSIPDGMMSAETAKKAVDIALSSPDKCLSFEFQGGEPLANFETIKYIVEYTESVNHNKNVQFSLVSNLTLLTDEIAQFIKEHNINVSTSVDGNKTVHNSNRTYRNGKGSFDDVIAGINILKKYDIVYGAIQTTTKNSLKHPEEIVDEYVNLDLESIFIRNLTPLGCANKNWEEIGYSTEEFLEFYEECFNRIIEINKKGRYLKEGHASIFLSKILNGVSVNYMELRSPCGAGLGQIAYYYDGSVYTCDEGRMIAEMGDDSFKLGTVDNSYEELINSNNCKAACISSILESLPNCSDCVYNPYCGTCPVVNFAISNNIYNREPRDYKCKIYSGMLDIIFNALRDEEKKKILLSWI